MEKKPNREEKAEKETLEKDSKVEDSTKPVAMLRLLVCFNSYLATKMPPHGLWDLALEPLHVHLVQFPKKEQLLVQVLGLFFTSFCTGAFNSRSFSFQPSASDVAKSAIPATKEVKLVKRMRRQYSLRMQYHEYVDGGCKEGKR